MGEDEATAVGFYEDELEVERSSTTIAELDDAAIAVGLDPIEEPGSRTRRRRRSRSRSPTDSLQLFLKDIGKVSLLTAAQEVELAKRIERGDHRAKQEMVEANLRLVVSIAKRYRNQGLPVPRPDPGGHDRARPRRREVRLPQGLQVLDVRDVVDPPGGRARARRQGPDDPHARPRRREAEQDPPRRAQAARRARARADVGRDRPRARHAGRGGRVRSAAPSQTPISLEKPVGDDDESEFGHFIEDDSEPLPDEVADLTLRNEALARVLGMLADRERRVLELRYGLNGEAPCTLDEVGRAFNVTRERIRQIENQSLKKLRALAEAQKLRDVA